MGFIGDNKTMAQTLPTSLKVCESPSEPPSCPACQWAHGERQLNPPAAGLESAAPTAASPRLKSCQTLWPPCATSTHWDLTVGDVWGSLLVWRTAQRRHEANEIDSRIGGAADFTGIKMERKVEKYKFKPIPPQSELWRPRRSLFVSSLKRCLHVLFWSR